MNTIKTSISLDANGQLFYCYTYDSNKTLFLKISPRDAQRTYPKEPLWEAVKLLSIELFKKEPHE